MALSAVRWHWHIELFITCSVEEAEVLRIETRLFWHSIVGVVESSGVDLVILPLQVIIIALFLLLLHGEVALLLLDNHFLMLLLHSAKLVLSLIIHCFKLVLVILIYDVLNLNDVFWLKLGRLARCCSNDWHLLWSSFSIGGMDGISWRYFDLGDWVFNLCPT